MKPPVIHSCDAPAAAESPPRSLFRSLRFWIQAVICLTAFSAVPIAFITGVMFGDELARRMMYTVEVEAAN